MSDDLMSYSPAEFAAFTAGFLAGRLEGIDHGWQLADEQAAAIHRHAHRVVQAMAALPTADELEQRRRTYRTRTSGVAA